MKHAVICCVVLGFACGTISAADDWTQVTPSPKPSARNQHAMAYVGEDNVLLFGGYDYAWDAETWIYDCSASTWTKKAPLVPHPMGRLKHSMAYIGDDKAIMFGGNTGEDTLWVYDLSANTWSYLSFFWNPSANESLAMAYIGDDKVLFYGGNGNGDTTWVYDLSANDWDYGKLSPTPTSRYNHDMAYIGDDKVLLFGGYTGSVDDETWVYDLSEDSWTDMEDGESWVSGTSKPAARQDHQMAYMGGDKVMLFGGSAGVAETWIYDLSDNSWTQDANSTQPSGRNNHGLAATSMDGSSYLVLFGGTVAAVNDETWTFGGGDYSLPVELLSFTAGSAADGIRLEWTTASETENLGFILERQDSCHPELVEGWVEIASYLQNPVLQGNGSVSTTSTYIYTDRSVSAGDKYDYRLTSVDYSGERHVFNLKVVGVYPEFILPATITLAANYPNPFNPATTIQFGLDRDADVRLMIYDIKGNHVFEVVNGHFPAGWHRAQWQGETNSEETALAGIYLVRLEAVGQSQTRKMILLQ